MILLIMLKVKGVRDLPAMIFAVVFLPAARVMEEK